MSANFKVSIKEYNGKLHLNPRGDFDGSSAWELVNLLKQKYNGEGQVIIDTSNLLDICPFGCSTFQHRLNLSPVPANRLSFKGGKGHEIAPRGSKVILDQKMPGCDCNGDCANCSCTDNKQKQSELIRASEKKLDKIKL